MEALPLSLKQALRFMVASELRETVTQYRSVD
jgi:hypothetical protein